MSTLLNSLTVAGETMLLTRTVSGISIHLTTTDASADARAAIRDRPDRSRGAGGDELLDNRWSPRSLCGRTWAATATWPNGGVNILIALVSFVAAAATGVREVSGWDL
jgi:hypothetical protein